MKVALVTNWEERCGVAEYAKQFVQNVEAGTGVDFTIVSDPLLFDSIMERTQDADIVHFNYASRCFRTIDVQDWVKFRRPGKKTMMTFHDSSPEMLGRVVGSKLFDLVVTHEPFAKIGGVIASLRQIPQPVQLAYIPASVEVQEKIGIAGIPFPWKGFQYLAVLTELMGIRYNPLLSITPQIDAQAVKEELLRLNPKTEVELLDWPKYEDIVIKLAGNLMNVFPYNDHQSSGRLYGISAAVRMAFAAKRPVIVSHCSQFKDLKDYQDEVYFIESGLQTTIERVHKDIKEGKARIPNRILQDMNWVSCANQYAQLYRELALDIIP